MTRRETYEVAKKFLDDIRSNAEPDCVVYLVGNKADLLDDGTPRQVSEDEVRRFTNDNKMYYIEKRGNRVINDS